MKYFVFAGEYYYPGGGVSDLHSTYCNLDGIEVCLFEIMDKLSYDWWQLMNSEGDRVISYYRGRDSLWVCEECSDVIGESIKNKLSESP